MDYKLKFNILKMVVSQGCIQKTTLKRHAFLQIGPGLPSLRRNAT